MQLKGNATAGDDFQLRRGSKQFGNKGRGRNELLKIVQYEKNVLIAQIIFHIFEQGTSAFAHFELLSNA
jgi:hypothetical protein